jgi:hypothetical protein
MDRCDLQLRKGPAHTRPAPWLFGGLATHAVEGEAGRSEPYVRRPSGAWMVLPERSHAVCHP